MLKEKNKYEKEKGITLVALVITVVVMLILAAVAIGSVTGDGLFSKTRQAAETYENASRTEGEQIQTLMNEIDEYLTENNVNEGVDPEEIAIVGDFVNYSVKVDSNGNDVIDEGETYDKWRILDFDNNGHMEIVCYNGPSFKMSVKEDYANAIQKLNNLLQERSEFLTDNKTAVLQLLKQIHLNKILQPRGSNQIVETDFSIISGLGDKANGTGIGFNSNVR